MAKKKQRKWLAKFKNKYKVASYFEKVEIERRCNVKFYTFAVFAIILSLVWIWVQILIAELVYVSIVGRCGTGEGSCGWGWFVVINAVGFLIIPYIVTLIVLRRNKVKLESINKIKKNHKILSGIIFGYAIFLVLCYIVLALISKLIS
ncbi:hypothetical protein IKG33_01810 [Candidatus Saccharibacteria bacterium]|nr:hypothetical protein [Candidatus Saccharibacteria bacterium]